MQEFSGEDALKRLTNKMVFAFDPEGGCVPEIMRFFKHGDTYVGRKLPFDIDRYENIKGIITILQENLNRMKAILLSDINKYQLLLYDNQLLSPEVANEFCTPKEYELCNLHQKLIKVFPEGIPKELKSETDEEKYRRLQAEGVRFYTNKKDIPAGVDGDNSRELLKIYKRVKAREYRHMKKIHSQPGVEPAFILEIIGFQPPPFKLEILNTNLKPNPNPNPLFESGTLNSNPNSNSNPFELEVLNPNPPFELEVLNSNSDLNPPFELEILNSNPPFELEVLNPNSPFGLEVLNSNPDPLLSWRY